MRRGCTHATGMPGGRNARIAVPGAAQLVWQAHIYLNGRVGAGCLSAAHRAEEACGRAQVFFKVLMGYRPPVPECMPQGFKDLLLACWVRALPRCSCRGP